MPLLGLLLLEPQEPQAPQLALDRISRPMEVVAALPVQHLLLQTAAEGAAVQPG